MPEETIRFVTDDTPLVSASDGKKVGMDIGVHYWEGQPKDATSQQVDQQQGGLKLHEVSVQKLEQEMASFMKAVDQMLSRAEREADLKSLEVSEVEVAVGITAEGSVSLVGLGAKVAGTRTISLKFRRKS